MKRLTLVFYIFGILALIFLAGTAYLWYMGQDQTSESGTVRILVIGNSFTYQNNIDKMVAELMKAQYEGARSIEAEKIAFGGYRLYEIGRASCRERV